MDEPLSCLEFGERELVSWEKMNEMEGLGRKSQFSSICRGSLIESSFIHSFIHFFIHQFYSCLLCSTGRAQPLASHSWAHASLLLIQLERTSFSCGLNQSRAMKMHSSKTEHSWVGGSWYGQNQQWVTGLPAFTGSWGNPKAWDCWHASRSHPTAHEWLPPSALPM